jgi:hypothetical protein
MSTHEAFELAIGKLRQDGHLIDVDVEGGGDHTVVESPIPKPEGNSEEHRKLSKCP